MKKNSKLSSKVATYIVSTIPFLQGGNVLANDDPFGSIESAVETGTENVSNVSFVIAILAIVIGGLGLMATRQSREWAKQHIGWVLVGVVVIVIAASLVGYIQNIFQ